MRIYIAEDNASFADLCARIASQEGWTATVCSNGRELLSALAEERGPALLLIDINMPELDGIEVIDHLLAIDRPLRVRFITGGLNSSALAARMIADARDLNVGRFLTKPMSVDQFRAFLAEEAGALDWST